MTDNRTMKAKATAKAVAFTGHREISHIHQEQVRERLKDAVLQAIRQGASKFYCGMALGFDMMAAEEVLSLKLSIPMLKLVAVVPFKGQSASWSMVEQQRYPISFPRQTMWCIRVKTTSTDAISSGTTTCCRIPAV